MKSYQLILAVCTALCMSLRCASHIRADEFRVFFSGRVTSSWDERERDRISNNPVDFRPFVDGTPFHGSFRFDSDLIETTQLLRFPSGNSTYRNYSAIREYSVRFELSGADYVYTPPLFDEIVFPGSPLGIWSVNVSASTESVSLTVPNYPAAWWSRPAGIPSGNTPTHQYVDGLYPHNSFFTVFDRTQPLDIIGAISDPNVDVQRLFDEGGDAEFRLRFTDPFHPDWQQSHEALIALVVGDVTSLRVVQIPEPSAIVLAMLASLVQSWRPSRRPVLV